MGQRELIDELRRLELRDDHSFSYEDFKDALDEIDFLRQERNKLLDDIQELEIKALDLEDEIKSGKDSE